MAVNNSQAFFRKASLGGYVEPLAQLLVKLTQISLHGEKGRSECQKNVPKKCCTYGTVVFLIEPIFRARAAT